MGRPSLTRSSEVRAYLREIGFVPSKSLGQNFLIDANMRDLIVQAAGIHPGDRVVEVGPGLGVMTEALVECASHVTAIELDFRLAEHLQSRFSDIRNLTIRREDATETNWKELLEPGPVRVVSNLPYSVGNRILYELADPERTPTSITVMVQKDVADRLLAPAGHEDYGLLTVRLSWAFQIRRVRNVPGNCFLPPPRVASSVVHLERRAIPPAPLRDPQQFESLVRFAFTRRRKQLKKILKDFGAPEVETEVDLQRRPETLCLEEWAELANRLSS